MSDILKKRRSKDQRDIDITRIAPLYLQGKNYREIAEALGLSIKQVAVDITTIKEDWRKTYIEDFNEYRKRELLKVDLIEAEAWEAWERSKKGRTSKVKSAEDSQQFGSRRSATEEHSESHGDVQYLQIVHTCVNTRARLLGIYGAAPVANQEVDPVESDANKFSRDEVLNLIENIAGRVIVASTQTPQNLLEAMKEKAANDNAIDAQFSEVVDAPEVKQLPPVIDIPKEEPIDTPSPEPEVSEKSEEEKEEEDSEKEKQELLDILKGRKAEKMPDPNYKIKRTRQDDVRAIIRDLDSTKVSREIYNERMDELDQANLNFSKTNQTIAGKNKVSK